MSSMTPGQNQAPDQPCFFVSDLHGHTDRFEKLFRAIAQERPALVFLGGDFMPGLGIIRTLDFTRRDFIHDFLLPELGKLREKLQGEYPRILLILGNDDGKSPEASVLSAATEGYWTYCQGRRVKIGAFSVYGYSYVPPTPFQLKDWERYDVSRYTDPGCISPEEGRLTVPMSANERMNSTIHDDLGKLAKETDLSHALFLFHSPPYKTGLDRAALDGKMVDHIPLDLHVGSIAIRRFIEERQPLATLHGHVHESASLTGTWKETLGRTVMLNASHSGPELSLIRFDLKNPGKATRDLL
jgi:uncharacterized protein